MRPLIVAWVLLTSLPVGLASQDVKLPAKADSARFAIIGDSGTGGSAQLAVAERLVEYYNRYPFEFALMLGDNLYGDERPRDYEKKFVRPYRPLLAAG